MIAWGWVLLFETGFVFFVNNDKTEVLERQEYGTSCSEDDVVGMGGELFLPYFHAFGITVLGVVDAETVAEHLVKPFHNLNGKGYLGQEIKYLLVLVESILDEVDVYFCLAARRYPKKKHDILLQHLHKDVVIGILLCSGKGFDGFEVWFAGGVQPSHFPFIGIEKTTVCQRLDYC